MSQRSLATARSRRAPVEPPKPNLRSMSHKEESSQKSNGLPFSKLSISDAIGLITLRLGKVESFLIEQQNNPTLITKSTNNNSSFDNTLLTSLNIRMDELEKQNYTIPLEKQNSLIPLDNLLSQINTRVDELEKQNSIIPLDNLLSQVNTRVDELEKQNSIIPLDNLLSQVNTRVDELEKQNSIIPLDNLLSQINTRVDELEKQNSISPLDNLISQVNKLISQFDTIVLNSEIKYNQYETSILEMQNKFMDINKTNLNSDDATHIINEPVKNNIPIDDENDQIVKKSTKEPVKKKERRKKVDV